MRYPAKTPLQRVLLSRVVPAQKQQELLEVAHVLNPILLFQQVEQLQKAVFRCATCRSPFVSNAPSTSIRIFSVDYCTAGTLPDEKSAPEPTAMFRTLYG